MTWTTFASLGVGPGTTPQLDANLTTLSNLVPIPCTVTGTNALVLTSTAGAATLSAYSNYMEFVGVAAVTNTGATTANAAGLGVLPIYKDTLSGPVALTGSEIVQNTLFVLRYDSTLNGSSGGFHLQSGTGILNGQTLSLTSLFAASASVSGLFAGVSLTLSGPASLASLSVSGVSSLATANIGAGNATLSAASISGLFSGTSLSLAGADALARLNSTLVTLNYTLTPLAAVGATVTLSGVQLNDGIVLGRGSVAVGSLTGMIFNPFVSAAGTVVVSAYNPIVAVTVTLTNLIMRVSNIGFVT